MARHTFMTFNKILFQLLFMLASLNIFKFRSSGL